MAKKEKEAELLEKETAKPDFWEKAVNPQEVFQRLSNLKREVEEIKGLKGELGEIGELANVFKADESLQKEVGQKFAEFEIKLEKEELKTFLSGKYDSRNALLEIFAGAGGQDSQDWATLLLRMYQRYCQNQEWKTAILEQSFGEAGGPEGRIGTKSATLEIKGRNAYGLLRGEAGVHRLVRISPFSSQALRHTSFAKVELIPEIENEKEVEIKPEDLKIEFYRASGPGGQNVNKRETSVRITHLPTRIIVSCQAERLQGDNRKKAMAMLASKLLQVEEEKREKETSRIRGNQVSASWGNQIRSYVLHPYKLVKDLRTGVESSEPERVLDGELEEFVEAEIRLVQRKA